MIVEIWPIKANKNNIKEGVNNSMRYVMDEEKTNVLSSNNASAINEPSSFDDSSFNDNALEREINYINSENNLHSVLNYMKNEHKTKKVYVSGYMCDPEKATEQFYLTKEINLGRVGKTINDDLESQAFHIVQSFPDDLDISDDEVHQCGIELCKKLEKYQAVVTSHLHPVYDENGVLRGKCKHNHILINSHMNPEFIDPEHPYRMKYNDCKETFAQLRAWNDEISIEHGLPIILNQDKEQGYSWFDTEINNQGKSWKQRVRLDIENNMQLSSSWNEFKDLMGKAGYTIKEGKYETYTTPEQQKVRGSTLGNAYTKEYMEEYWAFKKEITTSVGKEMEQNKIETIKYENLNTLFRDTDHSYFLKIPRTHKSTGEPYDLQFPLSTAQDENVINTYIKDENTYSLYRDKNHYIGNVSGAMVKNVLLQREFDTYEQQKKWEELETKRREQEDLNRILKEQEEFLQYTRKGWNNSKSGYPYHIGLYNEDGNRRTLLEQIFILAMVVITNEAPDYVIPEYERKRIEKNNARLALIIQKPDWKIERILEAISYAKEENIEDLTQLKLRTDECGKNLSKVKTSIRKNEDVRKKMEPIHNALSTVESLKETCEAIFYMAEGEEKTLLLETEKSKIDEYNVAKATLYHYKIDSEEKISDFKARYENCLNLAQNYQKEYEKISAQYTKLKKIKYQIDLAMNKDYCYGTDTSKEKKQEKETESKL